ncbi:MAG: PilT/PilU family type 4a pilus ATPase [Planctomycetota bacterium]|nr:PilT/PilU family type 4a pilus ATPase [Planctomycetota bacterium]
MHNDSPEEDPETKGPVHISDDEFSFADVKPTLADEVLAESGDANLDLDSVESLISDAETTAAQVLNPAPVNPELAAMAQAHVQANHSGMSPRHQIEAWLGAMVKSGASDLILRSGGKPSLRISGRITFLPGEVPGPGPMKEILSGILGEVRMKTWHDTGSADAGLQLDGLGRFRINAYKQMGEPAIVIRRINEDAPELGSLHLPKHELEALALRKRGLIFVTGVAGSGKSTTLAGMIQHINRNAERHVITLEDPVELIFKEDRCVISQREVGTDTSSFSEGLKHALRQSPDVILIGEARDAETVIAALEATETGHMVLCTMHTVNAAQTIERLLGFFPAERHVQIRQRMADTLGGVLSQRLIQDKSGSLRPAYELMVPTPHVKELISEGKTTELARVIESGTEKGLISFNQCLLHMVQHGIVELDHALETSDRPEELLLSLRGISGGNDRGKDTSGQPQRAPVQPAPNAPTLSKPKRPNDDFPKGLK